MKKICLVTPTLGCGGVERVVSELSNYAISQGYDVTIVCLFKSKVYYDLDNRVRLFMPKYEYRKSSLGKLRTFFYLSKILFKNRFSCVLGFSEAFNPLTIFASKMTCNRVVVSDRSSPEKVLKKSTRILRTLSYPLAAGIIAQTRDARSGILSKKLNSNVKVIPNPLRVINDLYKKEYGKCIVSVGRLVPSKNFIRLIDIFSKLNEADDWSLVIIGDGPEKERLKHRILELGLSDRVVLQGEVRDVDYFFSKASIFAFTSCSEGFPNALSEAMAFPLACISYDCKSGPSDIIVNGENGILVDVNDEESFSLSLQILIDRPELIKSKVRSSVLNRNKFNSSRVCDKYLSFMINLT